ncbi:hypothetical protein AAMO2058_001704600 [Amorphochlora amoebiformis]
MSGKSIYAACEQVVEAADKITFGGGKVHRKCFACKSCGKVLLPWLAVAGSSHSEFYCKVCSAERKVIPNSKRQISSQGFKNRSPDNATTSTLSIPPPPDRHRRTYSVPAISVAISLNKQKRGGGAEGERDVVRGKGRGGQADEETIKIRMGKEILELRIYADAQFRAIRRWFGVSEEDLDKYLGEDAEPYTGGPSKGKSKSFIYFSKRRRFVLKTMNSEEVEFVRKAVGSYLNHIQRNPNTLLSRFYALYRLRITEQESLMSIQNKLFVCIMNNVFESHLDINIKFDLKGSTAGRRVRKREMLKHRVKSLIFKDLDFLGKNKDLKPIKEKQDPLRKITEESTTKASCSSIVAARKIFLDEEIRVLFVQQLNSDVKWLVEQNIMDYSLLCGVAYVRGNNSETPTLTTPTNKVSQPPPPPPSQHRQRKMRSLIPLNRPLSSHQQELLRSLATSNLDKKEQRQFSTMPSGGKQSFFTRHCGGIRAHGGSQEMVYFFGIIDICQEYNLRKRAESNMRGLINTRSTISAVPPGTYGQRFLEFMTSITGS